MNFHSSTTKSTSVRHNRGFSLIELLIVVGIAALLISLIAYSAAKFRRVAEIAATRTTIAALQGINDEFQAKTKLAIPHLDGLRVSNGVYVNIDWTNSIEKNNGTSGTAVADDTSERFLWWVLKHPDLRNAVNSALEDDQLIDGDGDGFLEIRDSWGTQIYYADQVVHDDDSDGDKTDAEGTLDADDFLPEHHSSFFASAGPDGLWGDASDPSSLDQNGNGIHDEAEDNIYSYKLDD